MPLKQKKITFNYVRIKLSTDKHKHKKKPCVLFWQLTPGQPVSHKNDDDDGDVDGKKRVVTLTGGVTDDYDSNINSLEKGGFLNADKNNKLYNSW